MQWKAVVGLVGGITTITPYGALCIIITHTVHSVGRWGISSLQPLQICVLRQNVYKD